MEDLLFIKYIQLTLFTAWAITFMLLMFVIIKEKFKKEK